MRWSVSFQKINWYTQNPIRENIVNFKDKKDEEKTFNIDNNNITVLVGGSLGSKTTLVHISKFKFI